ncbi:MAG: hypothetical protein B7Z47_03175, partial [Chthoniobacter sp. 12-60-6]
GIPADVAYDFTNQVICGTALLMAEARCMKIKPLVLWDRLPCPRGGTADFVSIWRKLQHEPAVIAPLPVHAAEDSDDDADAPPSDEFAIKSMVFADVVGFSRLPGRAIPAFAREFMGGMKRVIQNSPTPPQAANTWGDAIYLAFDTPFAAADAASRMREWTELQDWSVLLEVEAEAPAPAGKPLRLRIGLHAGPVYCGFDDVIDKPCFLGGSTNRAARIEPMAEEGQIYCSEEFAALLSAEGTRKFRAEYQGLGTIPKTESEIRIPVYRLVPAASA